jgi:hypothetical protein
MNRTHRSVLRQHLSSSRHEVKFGDLTIYEFHSILGDNPAVSDGSPLTLEWRHESQSTMPIDVHEYIRQSRPRRKRKEMRLTSAARDTYLLSEGYSLQELLDASNTTKLIQEQRRSSLKGTSWDRFRKAVDKAVDGTFNFQKKVAGTAA